MTDVPADLDTAADELYAGLPQDFTARRDRLAKAVRATGDRDLSTKIKGLRRPTVAAWLVNLAAHEEVSELQELLDVGEQLREAQASLAGDRMRELSTRRQQLERVVLQRVRELARERGQDVAPQAGVEVEETLRAALADPKAALAVSSGHLTRALSYAGLGEVDIEAATATPLKDQKRPRPSREGGRRRAEPPAPSEPPKKKAEDDDTQARARELRDAVQQARDRLEKATKAKHAATAREEQLEERAQRLHDELQQVRGELAEATKEASHAEREHSRAVRALASAERDLARLEN